MAKRKKKVFITGVAGLIGSRLADWILENTDCEVIGIDDLSGGYIENVSKKVTFHKLDVNDTRLDSLFKKYKPDYVFHFAAYAAEGLSPFIRKYNYTNNLLATAAIVNNCITHAVKRLVFTSSMAVYGSGNPPFDETHIPNPVDPYGVAKMACEKDIQIAGEQHSLDWCIIRPHNVYGIKQNIWDNYRNVLGIWMWQYLNNEPMTIFGDGEQTRAFSYIDDCLEPLWKAAKEPKASKQIVNLGGTTEVTINEANRILREVVGGGKTVYMEKRHEVKQAHSTWQKSVELLGYKDTTPLKEGLTAMWEWARKQPKRKKFMWKKYEVEKNLYSFWKKKN
ncbi:MAG: NAD-dependent epimerase/dehydratase [Parcubacteria group bacterium GW2011_GWA2_47_16]|nr:MAG: NAD-dependent epimerase/dehydratase [Parcubacteria group bacterium GW2011_GWA2_47_16]